MKKTSVLLYLHLGLFLFISCTQDIPPTATPEPIVEIVVEVTATPEPTAIPPTFTPEPTVEPTATAVPTEEPVVFATAEPISLSEAEFLELRPWQDGALNPEFTVTDERQGACWLGSLIANRPDAWRCATPDETVTLILDPCFANLDNPEGELACVNADLSVTLLALEETLPEEFANEPGLNDLPLRVILEDGNDCGLILGTSIEVTLNEEPQRINYACQAGGVLVGMPSKENDIWTIAYSGDPQGGTVSETRQIVQAFAFNGDTATVGGAPIEDGSAQVTDIRTQDFGNVHQLIFEFDSPNFPAFEASYVNEPYENIPEGAKVLRFLFSYPVEQSPAFNRVPEIIGEYPEHINEIFLVEDDEQDVVWAIGLDQMVGFDIVRSAEDQTVTLSLYEPVPNASDRPDLGVGSRGEPVLAVQHLLFALGYLNEIPEGAKYDEPTRKAVVAFQADHGIIPDGVVGAETWAAFEREVPEALPEAEGKIGELSKRLSQETVPQVVPNSASGTNVRSGPGMNYETIGTLPAGEAIDVVGIQEGDSLTTTWLQVCCINGDQVGWVRADVVRLDGSTEGLDGASSDHAAPGDPIQPAVLPSNRPSHTTEEQPILYFTFDDGPDKEFTEQIAAELENYDGFATYFSTGQNAEIYPDIIKAVHDNGHSVQNHTYSHASLDTLNATDFYNEVESTQTAIANATGEIPVCLRPPYGATTQETFNQAAEMGLEIAMWDIDTQDWRRPGTQAIADHVMESVFAGAIVLMHDGGGDRSQTVEALQIVLPQLQEQGYVFGVLCR